MDREEERDSIFESGVSGAGSGEKSVAGGTATGYPVNPLRGFSGSPRGRGVAHADALRQHACTPLEPRRGCGPQAGTSYELETLGQPTSAPSAGEGPEKDVKIVGTNSATSLESIKLAKNEPKTNPKRTQNEAQNRALTTQIRPNEVVNHLGWRICADALRRRACTPLEPRRGALTKPRPTAWVRRRCSSSSPGGATYGMRSYHALSGLESKMEYSHSPSTQAVSLGFVRAPLRGCGPQAGTSYELKTLGQPTSAPSASERPEKDVKIVGTNSATSLESIKLPKNELKTNPKRTLNEAENPPLTAGIRHI